MRRFQFQVCFSIQYWYNNGVKADIFPCLPWGSGIVLPSQPVMEAYFYRSLYVEHLVLYIRLSCCACPAVPVSDVASSKAVSTMRYIWRPVLLI